MPTLVACLWRRVEAIQPCRVPTHFGPATRLGRPKSPRNQGALATSQVEMCPRTANSGLRGELEQVRSERDDLRRRLDIADEERREKDRLLTALLTDQRHKIEAAPVKAGFRFFGLEISRSRTAAS